MNPIQVVSQRWRLILGVTTALAVLAYLVSSREHETYTSTSSVQIVLGSQQTGGYVDPNTLDELTNVYLQVAQDLPVFRAAGTALGVPATRLQHAVVPAVAEPGVLAFTASTPTPAAAARYANAVSAALSASVASSTARQTQARVAQLQAQASRLQSKLNGASASTPAVSAELAQLSTLQSDISQILSTPGTVAQPLQTAEPPSGPASPRPLRTALLVAVLSLVIVPAIIYIISLLRAGFESPDEASTELGLPIVSVVPKCEGPDDHPTEAMRLIHIGMQLSRNGGDDQVAAPSVVLLVSATPGDGKTFVTRSLMSALEQDHTPAIFVDGDVHRHDFSSSSGGSAIGLTDALESPEQLSDLMGRLSGPSEQTNGASRPVRIVGAGTAPAPRGLVAAQALPRLMRRIAATGSPVYVDTPAILANSDGLILARYATDVLVVVHAKRTRRRDAAEAVRRLESVGAPVRGIVYNCASRRSPYTYGSYYPMNGNGSASAPRSSRGPRSLTRERVNRGAP